MIKIQLTQEHIDQGVRGHETKCPVALALQTVFPVDAMSVRTWEIQVCHERQLYQFEVHSSIGLWNNAFDSLRRVKPITLYVSLHRKTIRGR